MMTSPKFSYDQEADIMYISFSPGEKATTAVELHNQILLRFNRREKRAVGLTLIDFTLLMQPTDFGPRSFPLSGLSDLEPDWQEMVVDILKSPPVNQILKVLTYSPSISESTPIAWIDIPILEAA